MPRANTQEKATNNNNNTLAYTEVKREYSQDTANPNELAELSAEVAAAASAASLRIASPDETATRPPNAFGRGTPRATA